MKRFLSYLTTLLAIAFLAACGGGGGSAGGNPNSPAFFTTAPTELTLIMGSAQDFTVGGGRPPYSAASSNASVTVSSLNGNVLTLGGVRPGASTITLRDAIGETKTVNVTVATSQALATTAPGSVNLTIGLAGAQTYAIVGGAGSYTATSSNPAVASSVVIGNSLILTGLASGSATVQIRDSVGSTINVGVTVAPAQNLFTTAAPSVNLANNTTATYSIGGGTSPYTVTSSNTNVATVAMTGNNAFLVTARNTGSATVTVRDAENRTVQATVTVAPAAAFFTTAPSSVTVAVGGSPAYTLGGGVGPYTATSSNTGVATVAVNGTTMTITGVSAGSASVVARDSAGATQTVAVTVTATQTVALFTTAPSGGVTIARGTSVSYSAGGGTGPYTAVSSNISVVTVTGGTFDSSFTLNGLTAGSANVVIRDAAGNTVSIPVTVSNAQMSLNPSSGSALVGDVLVATISGGSAPYTATVTNQAVADVTIVGGNQLRIVVKQQAASVPIIVTDSTGNSASFTLTSAPGQPTIQLSPSSLTVAGAGTYDITLQLYGAAGAVNYFSSDPSLLPITASGTGSVTLTKPAGVVCGSPVVTISAIDSTGAKATSLITLQQPATGCP